METLENSFLRFVNSFYLPFCFELVFKYLGLNWLDHVIINDSLLRPTDIFEGYANPKKAHKILGWKAKYKVDDVIKFLIDDEAKNYLKII